MCWYIAMSLPPSSKQTTENTDEAFFVNLTTCNDGPVQSTETRQRRKKHHPTTKNLGKGRQQAKIPLYLLHDTMYMQQ